MNETRYLVYSEDDTVVHSGSQLVREGAMGTAEIVYQDLCDLPVGQYVLEPGTIRLEVWP